jgi:hypothetical protein
MMKGKLGELVPCKVRMIYISWKRNCFLNLEMTAEGHEIWSATLYEYVLAHPPTHAPPTKTCHKDSLNSANTFKLKSEAVLCFE